MLSQLGTLIIANVKAILRDRVLHAVLGVAIVLLVLVPSMSSFSMQQVQELAISLSLSATSLVLLVTTLLLGASAVWRDIERRYSAAVLTLPVSRTTFLLAKFAGCSLFLILCGVILALASMGVIAFSATKYPSELPILWDNILLAVGADVLKYILLAAIAVALSSLSTSFALPFFCSLAIFLAGSAAQEVYEYISGQFGEQFDPTALAAIKGAYYLLPNFAGYDFKVHAVYGLPVSINAIIYPVLYTGCYAAIVLGVAIWVLNRRELP